MSRKVIILVFVAMAVLLTIGLSHAQQWPVQIIAANLTSSYPYPGDVDGDGDLDVISNDGISLIWFENLQPGWMKHTITKNFPTSDGNIDIVDIDKDGDIDFTVNNATDGGMLAWFENLGLGAQWDRHIIASSLKMPTNRIGSANDIDGDGDVDVVTATWIDGHVLWFENVAGDTTWTEHVVGTIGNGATWTTLANMDRDKDLDIVAGNWSAGNIVWYENKLPGTNWPSHAIATLKGTVIAECADMDADGDMDVVTHSNSLHVLNWYENPSWTPYKITSELLRVTLGQVGDVDGDGDLDVTFGAYNHLGWCENLGDAKKWQRDDLALFNNAQVNTMFGLGDIDSDKDADIIATSMDFYTGIGDLFWYANPRYSTSVTNKEGLLPQQIALSQNYPNPFNNSTVISYQLPINSQVELSIYNMLGQKVVTLVSEKQSAGIHKLNWDARGLASGGYFYRLQTDKFLETKKMILIK